MPVLLVLVIYALIEISLFSAMGKAVGVGAVLMLVLLGFIIGPMIIRRSGENARNGLANLQSGMSAGKLSDQITMLLAGVLIALPGFFTDGLGLLLLFPPTRYLIVHFISRRMNIGGIHTPSSPQPRASDDVIEGEIIDKDISD